MKWNLSEAKNNFGELFGLAFTEGPQEVTSSDRESVFVISSIDFKKVQDKQEDFKSFLMSGDGEFDELEFGRDKSVMRDFEI